jgi:hypothetical protein
MIIESPFLKGVRRHDLAAARFIPAASSLSLCIGAEIGAELARSY